jgi:hypothetical protein
MSPPTDSTLADPQQIIADLKRQLAERSTDRGKSASAAIECCLTLLYEAASALMTRTRKRSRLRAWGVFVTKRRGMKRVTVAVARKHAVIMHRIWVTGDEFDFGGPVGRRGGVAD